LVEDPVLAGAAEGDLAAAVDDDLGAGVVEDLGGAIEGDGDRVGAAVEGDDAAGRDRGDEGVGGAAGGAAVADDAAWVRDVGEAARRRARRSPPSGLPAGGPSSGSVSGFTAIVYFYPMAAYQSSLTRYTLFTPAFRVSVSLVDGATEVEPLGKPRALGTIEDTRPSSLERRELDMSENALVLRLVGADDHTGENPFWGYLKYIHEHPKLGRDLEKRAAGFIGWVRKKAGR
jgi:hypothetical protein